jgi:signal transduction histidine kinase
LSAHVAHDLRNALNAVAVNLEVVRGRSARGAEASAIAPFAATASAQLELALAATEALLGFARAESEPADVGVIIDRLERLLAVRGQGPGDRRALVRGAVTSAPADLVRAVVARSVLSALQVGASAPCEITVADGIFLRVTGGDASAPSLDPELVTLASVWGIRTATRGHALELSFPPVTDDTPNAPA